MIMHGDDKRQELSMKLFLFSEQAFDVVNITCFLIEKVFI